MEIHIGQRIKQTAKSKGIGATELGRILKRTRANIGQIFSRKSIDPELLYKISKVLDYNFFDLYAEKFRQEKGIKHPAQALEVQLKAQIKTNEMQQKYIELLEEKLAAKNESPRKRG